MLLSANGLGVVAASFSSPISGAWHVDLTIATGDASKVTGAMTLDVGDGALKLLGTARATGVYLDAARVRLVAGAGGLGLSTAPRFYQQATVRIVLQDLLAAAGETLSSTADAVVLSMALQSWMVTAMPVASAIRLLMDEVGASWRMLADGTMWCGAETWPDAGVDFSLERQDDAAKQIVISTEAPVLMAGLSVGVFKANYVEHQVDAGKVTTTVWIDSGGDRMRDPLAALVKAAVPGIDYLALYRAKVVFQSGQRVDVQPDDARLAQSMTGIQIRHGLPGAEVTVAPGSYLRVGWDNGDPSKPFAALWDGGETVTEIKLKALQVTVEGTTQVQITSTAVTGAVKLGPVGSLPLLYQGSVDSMGVPVTNNPAAAASIVKGG